MPFKPVTLKAYKKLIKEHGCELVKGSFDWKLVRNGKVVIANIIVTHPGKPHVAPQSYKKTLKLLGIKE